MDREHANSEMGILTKENLNMVFFMARVSSNGLMEHFIKVNLKAMRLPESANIIGQMIPPMMD